MTKKRLFLIALLIPVASSIAMKTTTSVSAEVQPEPPAEVMANDDAWQFESEEEVWMYLIELCKVNYTPRCESNRLEVVRDGSSYVESEYSLETAFRSKSEVVAAATAVAEALAEFEGK